MRSLPLPNLLTFLALGAIAACASLFAHEAFGHGTVCELTGGRITLLTAIVFRCAGPSELPDIGGPLGNLVAAALAYLGLTREWIRAASGRLFLVLLFGLNLLWFAGQTLYSGLLDREDLALLAHALHWPILWRIVAVIIGIVLYRFGTQTLRRWLAEFFPPGAATRTALRAAYLGSLATGLVMAIAWQKDPGESARDVLLALGVAPLGLWFAAGDATRGHRPDETPALPGPSPKWMVTAVVLLAIFGLTIARGLGPLA
jgi:hypothetical protein